MREAREKLIDSLEIGDLIRLNGRLRIVRNVSKKAGKDRVRCITLSIQRCSWTKKPYTVINRADLYLVRLEVVKKGLKVDHSKLGRLLQDDILKDTRNLTCCDVVGIIA